MDLSRLVSCVGGCPRVGNRITRIAGVLIVLACGALAGGVPAAFAIRGHVFAASFGSTGSGAGQLSSPQSVAVDDSSGPAAGDVYVADTGNARVDQFDPSGNFIRAWGWGVADGKEEFEVCTTSCLKGIRPSEPEHSSPGQFDTPQFVAVDPSSGSSAGDVYVADDGTGLVQKFTGTGELVATWGNGGAGETPNGQLNGKNAIPKSDLGATIEGPFHMPFYGITVDSTGGLWVVDGLQFMFGFDQSGGFANSWNAQNPSVEPKGLAVDSFDNLYFYDYGAQLQVANTAGSRLGYIREGNYVGVTPATGLAVSGLTGERYVDVGGVQIERIASACKPAQNPAELGEDQACVAIETFGGSELTDATGLAVSAAETVYAVEPGAGVVSAFVLEPPGAASVENEDASFVTSSSATINAEINPKGLSTEYRFEYGPTASYGGVAPVPDRVAGSDFEAHEVSVHVQGLTAGVTYHFRVVAHNSGGTTYGDDQTFTTQPTVSGLGLLDGRSYELVTPPSKEGALIYGANFGEIPNGAKGLSVQASASGGAIVDLASRSTEAEPAGNAIDASILSTRGASGWSSQVIALPHEEATFISLGEGEEYRLFSEDLSRSLVQPFGRFLPLSSEASESTPYLRTDFLGGDSQQHCQTGCFSPLVTAGNTREGAVFGEALASGACSHIACGPRIVDATPDLHHVIVSSPVQLTSDPAPTGGLYEWSGGGLQLISQPPEGQEGVLRLAGTALPNVRATGILPGEFGARHAFSDDGSRVILAGHGLYLREAATGETSRLDAQQEGPASSEGGTYMTASTDASRIFFLDNAGLTAESSASGTDLYEYDVNAPAGSRLKDLTVDHNGGESADVKGVLGASTDGSYVYFTARGALVPGAARGECQRPSGNPLREAVESCNLYLSHNGVTRLIAQNLDPDYSGREEATRVSGNGRWLAFMSNRDLTGYDTRDAVSGHPDQEVYLYDASTGSLRCASCDPTGARPVGVELSQNALAGRYLLVNGPSRGWAAATVTPWAGFNGGESRYEPRFLSDGGRLFFNSRDALVAQDVNGTWDAYEYEPVGMGSCSVSSVTFGVRSGGCVGLLSSGSSPEESAFMDASESGGDAFFITESKLVSQDFDDALDVYDAHECSASAPCYPAPAVSPPVCSTGDSCKAAPSPQPVIFGSPSSATFSGAGNVTAPSSGSTVKARSLTRSQKLARALRACHGKPRGRRRTVCERRARKRFGSVTRSRKAGVERRGGGR